MVLLLGKMLGHVVNLTPSSPHLPTQKRHFLVLLNLTFSETPGLSYSRHQKCNNPALPPPTAAPGNVKYISLPFVPPAPPITPLGNKQMTNVEDLLGRSMDTQCP